MREAREVGLLYAEEVWNAGRLELIDELFREDHVYHDPVLPDLSIGPAGVRERIATFMGAMPDAIVTVFDWVEEGDALVARWSWSGTHTGDLLGMAPTNRTVRTTGMHMFHVTSGRVVESWAAYDALGLLARLGLVSMGPGNGTWHPKRNRTGDPTG
jgi:steroid delta-isomerase-like uncharacterized protein